jgi:hypothetical protein
VVVIALLVGAVAHAGGLVQVGTGLRPLSIPGTQTVTGGGLRIGPTFGPVTPFVGGTVQWARVTVDDDDRVTGSNWSVLAGVRLDLADLDRLAQPFVSAGTMFGQAAAKAGDDNGDVAEVDFPTGPGAFAGFGADAALSPAVRVGLEVGLAVSSARPSAFEDGDATGDAHVAASWSYADLHLVFRPRRRE